MTTQNPFIQAHKEKTFATRDESIPFDRIQLKDYLPALDFAIEDAKKNLEKIKQLKSELNFDNVIVALETSSELLEMISGTYFALYSAEASEEHQALAKDISPKLAAYSSDVSLDEKLFQQVKKLYDQKDSLSLNSEKLRLLEKTYKGFVRNGALLADSEKNILRRIDQELSLLSPKFSENLLKATNSFELWIDDKLDLLGLPDGVIESAAFDAQKKGRSGHWLFTLQFPSFMPFMQYSEKRELRKKMWMAYSSRAFQNEFDNQENVLQIVRLRDQRAKLLGYPTHAAFVLEERMAETPEKVFQFLNSMVSPCRKAAEKDLKELREFKKSIEGNDDIQPWDIAYYSEKLKEKKYKFNEEELRPYFQLEHVVEGVFEHARRLYGLTFKQVHDVAVYHPDVKAYEVREEFTQKYVGLFYTDFFPRETKKGGAWMSGFRDQGLHQGEIRRPHIMIVCNFTKPTPSKPSLLNYDEVLTLFHEFGHALHGLLSNVEFKSMGGTNVFWDFVELPSQIMENWIKEKEGLDIFARHYQTNEPIPAELVEKIRQSQKFQSGLTAYRQLNYASLDMIWHTTNPADITNVSAFEERATQPTRLMPHIEGTNMSCAFSHIFSGGYSAGYYSYKWAEVLDADAFEYFKEQGLFDRQIADRFKEFILSKGGSEHPMELYKKFRGREPDPKHLLKRDGLL